MRLIGHMQDNIQAERFRDFLYSQGIEAHVEQNASGHWEIWVLDDDQVESAISP